MVNAHIRIILALILTISATSAIAQKTGTVKGFIYNEETGEPEIFTNVYLEGTTFGSATDVNGYYSITKIPPGDYKLTVKSLGFETISESITVEGGRIVNKKLTLKKSQINLKEFEVSAEKQEAKTNVKISVVKATPIDIGHVPTIGGEADIATYMQTLPGVVFTGDQGGQLYIRGGSPIQNKVLLDGMLIYNPFHSIGFFSVFDTDIIRNADIYTGGFGAEHGGRISSVMDITTRDGNKNRIAGKVGASPFLAKALIEGPLKKPEKPGGASSSFLFSGKASYLEQSSKALYTYIDSGGLPFNFMDLYGKISFNGENGSKFNLFGFNFTDQVKYQAVSDLNWDAFGVGSNFILVPPGSPVLVEGHVAYSDYALSLTEDTLPTRSSDISGFNLGIDFKYFPYDNEIKYGIEVQGFKTNFQFFNSLGKNITQEQNTTELSGYLNYKIVKGLFVIDPGFRVQYYASLSTFSPEPRLGIKFNANENLRFKVAGGIYSQNLISANSDRDVVNLFYGFLSGPDNLQQSLTLPDGSEKELTHKLQKANHYIAGFEYDITDKININVEGYIKDFTQVTNLNRNKIFEDNPDNFDKPDVLKKDFVVETGDAMGIDFVLKYQSKKLYLWAVYSIGKVNRWDGVMEYSPVFDRRHNVNLVGSYTFGEDREWKVDARWNMGSGLPFTQTQGYYQGVDFSQLGIGGDYTTSNADDVSIVYGDLNGGRLPFYHRLDFNLTRDFEISERSSLEASLGVTNVYNRENVFYFDRVEHERVNQLPIMPSLGLYWSF